MKKYRLKKDLPGVAAGTEFSGYREQIGVLINGQAVDFTPQRFPDWFEEVKPELRGRLGKQRPDELENLAIQNALPELIREARAGRELADAIHNATQGRYADLNWAQCRAALRQYQDSLKLF